MGFEIRTTVSSSGNISTNVNTDFETPYKGSLLRAHGKLTQFSDLKKWMGELDVADSKVNGVLTVRLPGGYYGELVKEYRGYSQVAKMEQDGKKIFNLLKTLFDKQLTDLKAQDSALRTIFQNMSAVGRDINSATSLTIYAKRVPSDRSYWIKRIEEAQRVASKYPELATFFKDYKKYIAILLSIKDGEKEQDKLLTVLSWCTKTTQSLRFDSPGQSPSSMAKKIAAEEGKKYGFTLK